MRDRGRWMALAAVTALVALGSLVAASPAQARPASGGVAALPGGVDDFTITSLTADYLISRDSAGVGQVEVTETYVVNFPATDQNRGLVRILFDDIDGHPAHTEILSVTDESGVDRPYTVSSNGGQIHIEMAGPDFVHGVQVYQLKYRQSDVIGTSDNGADDEFFWSVNGYEWAQPFAHIVATVRLDPAVEIGYLDSDCTLQSATQPVGDCRIARNQERLTLTADKLSAGEAMLFKVDFAAAMFAGGAISSPATARPPDVVSDNVAAALNAIVILFVLASLVIMVLSLVRRRPKRAAPASGAIPTAVPPEGMNIMAAAALLGERRNAVAAQLADLAVHGKIRLLGYASSTAAAASVQLVDRGGLKPTEAEVAEILFAGGPAATTRDFDPAAVAGLTALARGLDDSLPAHGLRAAPRPAADWLWLTLSAVLLFVAAVVSTVLLGSAFPGGAAIVVSLLAIGTSFACLHTVSTPTPLGRQWLAAFERVHAHLLLPPEQRATDDLATRTALLPWAVLWGLDAAWAGELAEVARIGDAAPSWFHGHGGFSRAGLVWTLERLPRGR